MARELAPETSEPELASDPAGGSLHVATAAFGAFYAAVTGFAIGGLEALSDRRAEARAARLRVRAAAPDRARRLRGRARRGSLD
jgi:hypothetical protein